MSAWVSRLMQQQHRISSRYTHAVLPWFQAGNPGLWLDDQHHCNLSGAVRSHGYYGGAVCIASINIYPLVMTNSSPYGSHGP